MRKNKIGGKNLDVYGVYRISGVNLDNLVNTLKNKGVAIRDFVKSDNKTAVLSVSFADTEKFFAITREMCYNIEKVGEKGRHRFLFKIIRNAGLFIGALMFFAVAALTDDFIFSIDYYGSGSVFSREAEEYLNARGVKPFTRFSEFDLAELSDGILACSDRISFAECVKSGNRLKVNLVLKTEPVKTLGGDSDSLLSDVDGEIEYIKVYRGTALKRAGDRVAVGEAVVGGFAVIKDTEVKTGVIATVSVKAEFYYEYLSEKDGDETTAEIFARAAFGDGEILELTVEKSALSNGDYGYSVKIIYRRILYG